MLLLAVYAVSGCCAAVAGIIIAADIKGADANNAGLWLELDAILAVARRTCVADEPVMRQRLADAHVGLEIMRLNALRTLAGSESGTLGRAAMVGKLHWATVHRDLGELAMDVLGAEAPVELMRDTVLDLLRGHED